MGFLFSACNDIALAINVIATLALEFDKVSGNLVPPPL